MPTLDLDDGLAPGLGPSDEQIHAYFRRYLPDFYFVNTPLSRMKKHLELLRALPEKPMQIEFVRAPGARFTELFLCADDQTQPGLLSKVAGTLSASSLNVHTAWIHTLRDPYDFDSGRKIVLDTVIVSENLLGRSRALSRRTEKTLTTTLADILQPGHSVELLMARKGARTNAPLRIHDLSISPAGEQTLIKINLADEAGVLYRVTRALAKLGLNIEHAQVNTFERSVDDVFFVTNRDGLALGEEEMGGLPAKLRRELGV